ncbi:MAG TPA: cbb3-type cytochrome c oxidase subunit I [Prosthecobacter sp.]|nr:cbb3-type cytochrome c oxidase subunit I [Prosthecobacter sp.]
MQTSPAIVDPDFQADSLRRAAIDKSVKAPVLFLFLNGAFWLMASTVLGLVAAIKYFYPPFLGDWAALQFGRLQPAHINALVYGWGIQAGLGVMLWIMARRSGQELTRGRSLMIVAGVFWNIAVTLGILGILFGRSTSIEWMEMPKFTWPILLVSFLAFAWPMATMFGRAFRPEGFMVSTWYILGACFWFPWIFLTANVALHCLPGLGALGTGINAWYLHGLILLFFTPVAIGSAYYFIPKITGQPVASDQLSKAGFWSLAILGGWTGMQHYMGGPLPAWMPAIGAMAGVLLLIPVGLVGWNHHLTTLGQHRLVGSSPTLRFIFVGALFYPVTGVILALLSAFATGATFQFTHAWYGFQIIAVYGFFSMCAFGAIYYIVPRVAGCEWLSVRLIRNHFWFSVYGIGTIVVMSLVAGLQQGGDLNAPAMWDQDFMQQTMNSHGYLVARAVAWALITWSNVWFLIHLMLMVAGLGRRSSAPTLLEREHGDITLPHGANA